MGSKKKTTTTSNQQTSATTQLPAWMTAAGESNYNDASAYLKSGAADWSADKAATYANPFIQQVQQRTLAQMGTQQAQERAQTADGIQAARAYGGTRGAVLEAQQLKDQDQATGDYLAQSNAQGFDQARAAFEADRAAKLGGYQTVAGILSATPRNVTTTGTQSGTQTQEQKGSWIDTVLGGAQIAAGAGLFSDPRLKRDVTLVERHGSGLGVYLFRYLWDAVTAPFRVGFMADEVERIVPDAVGHVLGYRMVNYRKLREVLA